MQAQRLPASVGWRWLVHGYGIFRRKPALMLALVAGYWMILLLSGIVPLVGSVIGSIIAPALSVGVMNACRQIDRGQPAAFDSLFSAFRHNPRTLFALGALYLATTLAILGIISMIDGGTLFRAMTVGGVDAEDLAAAGSGTAAQVGILLMSPVVMAWWYAPMLASWHGTSAAKALFFSFVACWRNWRAFLAYGAGAALLTLPPLFILVFLAVRGGAGMGVAVLMVVPAMMFLAPMFFASFYVSYRDVFVAAEPPPPAVDLHA